LKAEVADLMAKAEVAERLRTGEAEL